MEIENDIKEDKINKLSNKKFDIGMEKSIKSFLYKQYSSNGYFLPRYNSSCVTNSTLLALQDTRFQVPKTADIDLEDQKQIKLCFSPYLTWEKVHQLAYQATGKYLPFYGTPEKEYIKTLLIYYDIQNNEKFFYVKDEDEERIGYINDEEEFDIVLHSSANFQNDYYKRILEANKKIKRKIKTAITEKDYVEDDFLCLGNKLNKVFDLLTPQDLMSFKNTDFFENFLLIENAIKEGRDFRHDELKKILNVVFDFDMSVIIDCMEIKRKEQLRENKERRGFFYDQSIGSDHFKGVNLFDAYKKNGYYFFEKLMCDDRLIDITEIQKRQIEKISLDIDKNVKKISNERIAYLKNKLKTLDENLIKQSGKSFKKINEVFTNLKKRLKNAKTYSELKSHIETIDYFVFMIRDFTYKKESIVLEKLKMIKKRFKVKPRRIDIFDIDDDIDGKSAISNEERSEREKDDSEMYGFDVGNKKRFSEGIHFKHPTANIDDDEIDEDFGESRERTRNTQLIREDRIEKDD